jgi:hypothetical protein
MKRYLFNLLIALDQFGNTLMGGYPDETISSRAGKLAKRNRTAYWLCRALHLLDPNHCRKAIELDEGDPF